MSKREETPDVLGQLLGGRAQRPPEKETPEERAKADAPSEEEPQEKPTSMPARQQASKPARQRASKPVELPASDEKAKATYYLSPETLDALEGAWLRLRRLAGQDKRGQISKSAIVEASLLMALEELRAKEEESRLATMLVSQ